MKLGMRKLVVILSLSLLIFLFGCLFLWLELLTNVQWVDLSKWIGAFSLSAFTGGNIAEHFISLLKEKKEKKDAS